MSADPLLIVETAEPATATECSCGSCRRQRAGLPVCRSCEALTAEVMALHEFAFDAVEWLRVMRQHVPPGVDHDEADRLIKFVERIALKIVREG